MKWTTVKPNEAGWYWVEWSNGVIEPRKVLDSDGILYLTSGFGNKTIFVSNLSKDVKWSDSKIELPEES